MTLSGPRTRMPSPRNLLARERRKRGRNRFPKPWPKTLTSSSLHPPMKYPSEKKKGEQIGQQSSRTRNHSRDFLRAKEDAVAFWDSTWKDFTDLLPSLLSSDRNSLASQREERRKILTAGFHMSFSLRRPLRWIV